MGRRFGIQRLRVLDKLCSGHLNSHSLRLPVHAGAGDLTAVALRLSVGAQVSVAVDPGLGRVRGGCGGVWGWPARGACAAAAAAGGVLESGAVVVPCDRVKLQAAEMLLLRHDPAV
ncbi:hypothetical protein WMY93_015784 [Mugilogobius chulae]|uniref:Uncharacterized protein n=1 Tax=Mugilogobius chulae TaxID=88201 RepID=A0AAW0NS74_9GOBI